MSEQQQPESPGRQPTVSEISAAGAPNYRGRALHPQVQIDDKGLMFIGPIPPNKQDKRTVSVPVKVVALGEQGQEQYAVRASDDNDRLELVVSSGPDLLRIDRCSPTSGGARTPWLAVPAKNLFYVKVTVNRWQDGKEGSDVLIAAAFKAEDRPTPLVLLIEVDTRHRDSSVLPPDNKTPRRLDTSFDPNALEHIKAFFLSWQQKDHCRTEIDPTRALAVPLLPGQSLSSRPPIPEGYDPHDSTTWVAPFGPVSGDQEALYLDDAARKKVAAAAAAATTAKAAGKGKARVKDKNAVVAAQVEAGPGPRPEANTNTNASASATASSTAAAQQIVAGPPPDEEPMVVITQSGRTVRPGRRVHFPSSAIDRESVEDDEDDAARKETAAVATVIATTTTTARGKAKVKVGVTVPAAAGAGDGPEASSSAKPSNGASSLPSSSSSSSSVQKSVTPQATPAPPPAPPPPPPAAAPVMITQSGRTVRSLRNVHFTSSIRTESDNDDAEREEAPERAAAAAAATKSKRKHEPNPKVGVTAAAAAAGAGVGPEASSSARQNGASSSSAQKTVTPEETPEAASVVITQSGRTVRSLRNVHLSYSINTESDDNDDDDAARKYPAAASKPKPRTRPKVAAAASSSGAQSVGPAAADTPPVPPAAAAAEAAVVITQSGRTVKTRLVHSLPSDSEDDDAEADAAEDDEEGAAAEDFSPPPSARGRGSSKKKKKPPAKRLRVGRKESEPVVAVAAGDGDGDGGGDTQEGRGCKTEKGERAQKADVDCGEEQVMQEDLAGATTMDGGFATDRQEPQREVVAAQEAVPWPTMDRLPFALPPLPPSTTTATGAAGYPPQQQQHFGLDATTTMTTRSSSRRSGGAPNADAGASTAFR